MHGSDLYIGVTVAMMFLLGIVALSTMLIRSRIRRRKIDKPDIRRTRRVLRGAAWTDTQQPKSSSVCGW